MTVLNVFLIGKTGHGKSSTGNSLLGREVFVVSDSAESVTNKVQSGTTNSNGQSLLVVDGPGLGDTRMDTASAISKACSDVETGINQCSGGVHTFLLVLKYGNRFTEEEQRTVESLKSILGANVLRDFCVFVFTHGEVFDMMNQKKGLSFQAWCGQQTGALGSYLRECGNRSVLFYNADPAKNTNQIKEVLGHVTKVRQTKGSYTRPMYMAMVTQHQMLIARANAPQIRANIESQTQSLRQQLSSIQGSAEGFDAKLSHLASLGGKVRQVKQQAISEDKGTGILNSQQQSLNVLEAEVGNHEKIVRDLKVAEHNRVEAERQRQAQIEADRQAEEARRRRRNDDCTIL